MNRFKWQNKSLDECSKLQRDFVVVLKDLSGKEILNANPEVKFGSYGGRPIDILQRRYEQLRDVWCEKQPTEFQDIFEVNSYCSEAFAYVSKLETMIESVKMIYREHWYREQYKAVSKHGFHALLAGTHSIFVLYKILKGFFYLIFIVTIGLMGWDYLETGTTPSNSDMEFLAKCFLIAFGAFVMEVALHTIFGKNHQQIIRDNIKKQEVPDSALSAHLLTIAQDTKKLRDDIEFFQQQWIKKLGG